MTTRNSALALDLKRAFLGLARFAPLTTTEAFQEWKAYHRTLREVYADLTLIEQERPGLLDELLVESIEMEGAVPEIEALIARYTTRSEAGR